MPDQPRTYRMQRRAETQEQTRERITESAVALHGSVGPSQTTISAIAERAGVRRSTVYRHFADESSLFDACSAHWMAANPLPDLGAWAALADPHERLATGLAELHGYYGRVEAMLDHLLRDESIVPAVAQRFVLMRGYFAAARDTLMAGRRLRGVPRRRTEAAIGHAIAYSTWKSLTREQGLPQAEAGVLLEALVAGAV